MKKMKSHLPMCLKGTIIGGYIILGLGRLLTGEEKRIFLRKMVYMYSQEVITYMKPKK